MIFVQYFLPKLLNVLGWNEMGWKLHHKYAHQNTLAKNFNILQIFIYGFSPKSIGWKDAFNLIRLNKLDTLMDNLQSWSVRVLLLLLLWFFLENKGIRYIEENPEDMPLGATLILIAYHSPWKLETPTIFPFNSSALGVFFSRRVTISHGFAPIGKRGWIQYARHCAKICLSLLHTLSHIAPLMNKGETLHFYPLTKTRGRSIKVFPLNYILEWWVDCIIKPFKISP